MSQDPGTIFGGLSLQRGMKEKLKMFEKNIHCSPSLSMFPASDSLTIYTYTFLLKIHSLYGNC